AFAIGAELPGRIDSEHHGLILALVWAIFFIVVLDKPLVLIANDEVAGCRHGGPFRGYDASSLTSNTLRCSGFFAKEKSFYFLIAPHFRHEMARRHANRKIQIEFPRVTAVFGCKPAFRENGCHEQWRPNDAQPMGRAPRCSPGKAGERRDVWFGRAAFCPPAWALHMCRRASI